MAEHFSTRAPKWPSVKGPAVFLELYISKAMVSSLIGYSSDWCLAHWNTLVCPTCCRGQSSSRSEAKGWHGKHCIPVQTGRSVYLFCQQTTFTNVCSPVATSVHRRSSRLGEAVERANLNDKEGFTRIEFRMGDVDGSSQVEFDIDAYQGWIADEPFASGTMKRVHEVCLPTVFNKTMIEVSTAASEWYQCLRS